MEEDEIVLCDTDIIIELYKNNSEVIQVLQKIGQRNIAISTITAGELIYGALNKKEMNKIIKDIESLNNINIDYDICSTFIQLMKKYSLSHNLSLPDGFIAATAIERNLALFTLNKKDFRFIKELKLF